MLDKRQFGGQDPANDKTFGLFHYITFADQKEAAIWVGKNRT